MLGVPEFLGGWSEDFRDLARRLTRGDQVPGPGAHGVSGLGVFGAMIFASACLAGRPLAVVGEGRGSHLTPKPFCLSDASHFDRRESLSAVCFYQPSHYFDNSVVERALAETGIFSTA